MMYFWQIPLFSPHSIIIMVNIFCIYGKLLGGLANNEGNSKGLPTLLAFRMVSCLF